MKKQLLLLVLGLIVLSSCGTYHNKMRFSQVKVEKENKAVSSNKTVGHTSLSNDETYISENEENSTVIVEESIPVEENTRNTLVNEEMETTSSLGLNQEVINEKANKSTSKKSNLLTNKSGMFGGETPVYTQTHPLAIVGFSSSLLSAALSVAALFGFQFSYWLLIIALLVLVGIVTSIVAISTIKNQPRYTGMGFAIAGLVLSISVMFLGIIILFALILFFSLWL